ncbi:unnamed protein product [Rotaria sordida]|uniref:Uncharacterized protein n=1 Tax=Rotaria sordida TaxID=392033 RepID=A0A820A5W4_9BILA|nr:unnamed protein product [Rotaria sordida]CAF4188081.1 unnamed protein product [Rotaria sordida]
MEPKVLGDDYDHAVQETMLDTAAANMKRPDDEHTDTDGDGGVKGKLPGEEDDAPVEAVEITKKPKTASPKNPTNADEDDDKEEEED